MLATFNTRLGRTIAVSAGLCLATSLIDGHAAFAGYPDVWQDGDTLHIEGDNDANDVAIVGAEDTHGKVAVYIHKDPWIYTGVENIDVDLAGGSDIFKAAQLAIAGDLTVTTGSGGDTVLIGGWQNYAANEIAGNVFIGTGNGQDAVVMENTDAFANVAVDTGEHDDFVAFGLALASDLSSSGVQSVGNTFFGALDVFTGGGADLVRIARSQLHSATIDTENDDDVVIVGQPDFPGSDPWDGPTKEPEIGDLKSNDRDGRMPADDRNSLTNSGWSEVGAPLVVLDELFLYTGSGSDEVTLHYVRVDVETAIELEDEPDQLRIASPNEFNGEFDAHGGSDQDILENEPQNDYESSPSFHSFEIESQYD